MQLKNYELSVCVNGRVIPEFGKDGHTYIRGQNQTVYSIRFKNNTSSRVLVVFSVDGLDCVDGEAANDKSRGYVVPAYQSCDVNGWRASLTEISAFKFDTKEKSFSAKSQAGEVLNCGVIAAKVFAEEPPIVVDNNFYWMGQPLKEVHHHHHHHDPVPQPWWTTPTWCGASGISFGGTTGQVLTRSDESQYGSLCAAGCEPVSNAPASPGAAVYCCSVGNMDASASNPAPTATLNMSAQIPAPAEFPTFNLGTGCGERRTDVVTTTEFKRGAELAVWEIYYTDEAGLRAAGIDMTKKVKVVQPPKPRLPQAFGGFCKIPEE